MGGTRPAWHPLAYPLGDASAADAARQAATVVLVFRMSANLAGAVAIVVAYLAAGVVLLLLLPIAAVSHLWEGICVIWHKL